MQDWAVFTGDIVKSTEMDTPTLEAVFDALRAASVQIEGWQGAPAPFVRFRGDGWQMALAPRFALRAALVVRARVRANGKGISTRIGIGIGAGDLGGTALAAADGPAFVASGHALDTMKRAPLLAAPEGPVALRTALPLADVIASGWTPKQAEVTAVLLDLQPPTQDVLAKSLGRSRQATQKQAEGAGLAALLEACTAFEGAV